MLLDQIMLLTLLTIAIGGGGLLYWFLVVSTEVPWNDRGHQPAAPHIVLGEQTEQEKSEEGQVTVSTKVTGTDSGHSVETTDSKPDTWLSPNESKDPAQ